MKSRSVIWLIALALIIGVSGFSTYAAIRKAGSLENNPYDPIIRPEEFSTKIDNRFFSLKPGQKFIYQGETEEGTERIETYVTDRTKKVRGVTTRVVHDRVWLDGELIEDTFDWYAQHEDGAVWYFGEDSKELEAGKVVNTKGSWEAGIDGAEPGIIMEADPEVGDSYRQEYYEGVAEDMGEVVALDQKVTVPFGTFKNILKTRDSTPLEPYASEHKYYSPEIGFVVLEESITTGEIMELITATNN